MSGRRRRRKRNVSEKDDDDEAEWQSLGGDSFEDFEEDIGQEEKDPSVEFYPNPYCGLVEGGYMQLFPGMMDGGGVAISGKDFATPTRVSRVSPFMEKPGGLCIRDTWGGATPQRSLSLSLFLGMDTACLEHSILELWAENGEMDEEAIDNMTREDILNRINKRNTRFFSKKFPQPRSCFAYSFSFSFYIQWPLPY